MILAKKREEEFKKLWDYIERKDKKNDFSDMKGLIKSAFDNGFNSGAAVIGEELEKALFGGEKH